jgi:D-serine deaminase-like pyridoxal phosphate-dependent protein
MNAFPDFQIPSTVETPSICVVEHLMEKNIAEMQQALGEKGVACRPHIKSHKSIEVGRRQIAGGAKGLTTATIGEAEVFVGAGVEDILIAYPLWVSKEKARRLHVLLDNARVAIGVSSVAAAEQLGRVMGSTSFLRVLVEIDSGELRTGVMDSQGAVDVANACTEAGIRVAGVFSHGGMSYGGVDAVAPAAAAEARVALDAASALRAAGHDVTVVSAGSTPTALLSAVDGITEERPGTYVFGDRQQAVLGAHAPDSVALFVATTVVQVTGDRFVLDAGAKVFTKDLPKTVEGYGALVLYPDAIIERLYDHHAVVSARGGAVPRVGDRIAVIPNHVCPVTNLAKELVILNEEGQESDRWLVDAGLRNI